MVVIVLNIVAVVGLVRSIAVVAATHPATGAGRARRTARAARSRARLPHPAGGMPWLRFRWPLRIDVAVGRRSSRGRSPAGGMWRGGRDLVCRELRALAVHGVFPWSPPGHRFVNRRTTTTRPQAAM
jgi:hypothetical protein